MRILGFLLIIGVIFIATYIISQVILTGLGAILAFVFRMTVYDKTFRAFVASTNLFTLYLLTALITITILKLYEKDNSQASFVLYSVIGAIAVFGITTNSITEKMRNGFYTEEMERNVNDISSTLIADIIISVLSVPFFVLTLLVPVIATNPMTNSLFKLTGWALGVPVIGWIIAIAGLFLSLSMIKNGVVACMGLLMGSANLEAKKSNE